MNKIKITWDEVFEQLAAIDLPGTKVYGIPKGGMIAAGFLKKATITPIPDMADVILDDIFGTGSTLLHYAKYKVHFHWLFDTRQYPKGTWLVMPWEAEHPAGEDNVQQNITRQLQYIGETCDREGLLDTPRRVVKSWGKLYEGYAMDSAAIFTCFESNGYDQMILLKDFEFYSMCLAGSTFIDTPKGRIPISKLKDGEWVYCYDEEKQSMTLAKASNPRITGKNKQLWRVYSDKDTILCTGNHKFLTYNRGWIEAQNLLPGDSVVALNKGTIVEGGVSRAYLNFGISEKQRAEHRFVYEEIHGAIAKNQHIHHIDKQPNNNSPENLQSLSQTEHNRLHRTEDNATGFALFTDEQRKEMKQKQIEGIKRSQTQETRNKRAISVKKSWDVMTPQQKAVRNHRILLVEKTEWFEDVWCMDIPIHNNFVANGMVVHNCEHHMLPFFGKAHVAYIPNEKIVGISKLARLVDIYARRLQIQERIGQQVTQDLTKYLNPKGAACILEANHMCMRMRGVEKQNSIMTTSSLSGIFLEDATVKNELLQLIKL